MTQRMEVPGPDEFQECGVEVEHGEERWIKSVLLRASDGDVLSLTWDEIARSVALRWVSDGSPVLALERELIAKLSVVREQGAAIVVRASCEATEFGGDLVVRVGNDVTLTDVMLRR